MKNDSDLAQPDSSAELEKTAEKPSSPGWSLAEFAKEMMKIEARLIRTELLLSELREILVWKDKRTGKTKLTPTGSTLRRNMRDRE